MPEQMRPSAGLIAKHAAVYIGVEQLRNEKENRRNRRGQTDDQRAPDCRPRARQRLERDVFNRSANGIFLTRHTWFFSKRFVLMRCYLVYKSIFNSAIQPAELARFQFAPRLCRRA